METLFIRADADSQMGTGHVMRCLAIAQAWSDQGGDVVFLMRQPGVGIRGRVENEHARILEISSDSGTLDDAKESSLLARENQAEWLVVDGYQFDADYQDAIKASGLRLLFLDDCGHGSRYSAELVLNQNLHANESLYQNRLPETELLLGPRYALLRREFMGLRDWKRDIPDKARKLLVTLGGSDPDNVTERVIQALRLAETKELDVKVLIGVSNPHRADLMKAVAGLPGISLMENARNMAELFAEADIAIAGAGSTCWELCFLGLPSLLIDLAENQRPVSRELERLGVAVDLGDSAGISPRQIADELVSLMASAERRTAMSEKGRALIDGRGAARVCREVKSRDLRLRNATEDDCALLWNWANDPEIRAAAFSSAPILWENHVKWFTARLADEASVFYIALDSDDAAVGQVRYQIEADRAVLSVNLDRQFRGKGFARQMLNLANRKLFQTSSVKCIDAFVKPGNTASLKTFASAGFRQAAVADVQGEKAIHFVLDRNGAHS
jgi:UDP-2,4-diacetamido-2,4,6-trideoxy-beta-L-altropyranose hydrolase